MTNANTTEFEKAFNQLNEKQKEAVTDFEGPMMVIAGPGTGKTQLLAVRIGYILQNTDIQAHNILALTYTDAGTTAMRQRLLKFIGTDAYKVNIYTFHGFCSSVIKENVEFFGGYSDLEAMSDLESYSIYKELIDSFPNDHPLKRFSGSLYFDRERLENYFKNMKSEGWTEEELLSAFEKDFENFKNNPDNQYKRPPKGFNKGDVNPKALAKYEKKRKEAEAAIKEFKNYNALLSRNRRFDYADMITWVLKAFKEHPDLLADYQERFQYILVDEYQDTNGTQNELVFALAEFWEKPNLFVVGDDDQAIYRFQGASIQNLIDFRQKFAPTEIVLENNYRSTQVILDESTKLIENNDNRLVNTASIDKNLLKSRTDNPKEINVHINRYLNSIHEQCDILSKIKEWHGEGRDLSKIAILSRKHKHFDNYIKFLRQNDIPFQLKKKINILEEYEVIKIITILTYLNKELTTPDSAEDLLFKILHYSYFKLSALDIAKVNIYCSRRTDREDDNHTYRKVLSDIELLKKLDLKEPDKIHFVYTKLEERLNDLIDCTPQVVFDKLFTKNGILDDVMNSSDASSRMNLINQFLNYIKDESTNNPDLTLNDILNNLKELEKLDISIPLNKIHYSSDGVILSTVHGSKGLEYDTVFMISSVTKDWEKSRNSSRDFMIPKVIFGDDQPEYDKEEIQLQKTEEERRLFYVAMTRARNELHINYSIEDQDNKTLEPSQFVLDINPAIEEHEFIALADGTINYYLADLMKYHQGKIELIDKDLVEKQLENLVLNATALNKYLKCPLTYYFENVLRVPSARGKANGFGNAMHYALEYFFIKLKKNPEFQVPQFTEMLEFFHKGMRKFRSHFTEREFKDLTAHGEKLLLEYYAENSGRWGSARDYHIELKVKNIEYAGVPISGMIDRIDEYDDGVSLYDYKSGSIATGRKKIVPPSDNNPLGTDYWRQMVFYSFLIEKHPTSNWKPKEYNIHFFERENEKSFLKKISVDESDKEFVKEQLLETYQGITNQKFDGCGEEDCRWCTFAGRLDNE